MTAKPRPRRIVARVTAEPGWRAVVPDRDKSGALVYVEEEGQPKKFRVHLEEIDSWGLLEPQADLAALVGLGLGIGASEPPFVAMQGGKCVEMTLGLLGPEDTLEGWAEERSGGKLGGLVP